MKKMCPPGITTMVCGNSCTWVHDVRFEHSVCCGSLMITYILIYIIYAESIYQ